MLESILRIVGVLIISSVPVPVPCGIRPPAKEIGLAHPGINGRIPASILAVRRTMDRFEDLRCFVQVVDQGSVTKAAQAMRLAPSAVSRRVKELEARLGTQLLLRTTRRMSLTEAGRTFHDRATRILADLEEAEAEVSDAQAALGGTLRVAAPATFGVAHLTPILVDFMRGHPAVEVDIDFSDRVVDLVAEGFELAIRIGNLRDSSLIARKIADVSDVVCAAPALVAEMGRPRHPQDLAAWPALCYTNVERPDIWRWRRGPDGNPGSVQMRVRMQSNNGRVLRDAAIAGLGVAREPSFIAYRAIERGELVPLLTDYRWNELAIYTVYPPTRHLSARARAFIDFVRARIGPRPYWETCLDNAVA
jgi:DNA-binding transcriptional LysR family regulator